eukprot:CAMPEP_0206521746 /NCGR_PEP_ID=MMETSP0324_2-20121206/66541_1 /ASSEMBLY_ACC=CAM_ASM_000836 /TAXON_ID=2866 /ORGANISM="Crypthecodinium cohnii, Strain Seligo" /LENGTH=39 /DNA_ID= /DNA_START= /DNA_END= /DNA_ORIENTATION=
MASGARGGGRAGMFWEMMTFTIVVPISHRRPGAESRPSL